MLGRPYQPRKDSNSSINSNASTSKQQQPTSNYNLLNPSNHLSANNINTNTSKNSNSNGNGNGNSSTSMSKIRSNGTNSTNSVTSSNNSSSSTSSLNSLTSDSTSLNHPKCSPCSPSILLNPTYMNPPSSKDSGKNGLKIGGGKKEPMTVLITHYPPAHFLGNKNHLIPKPTSPSSTSSSTSTSTSTSAPSNISPPPLIPVGIESLTQSLNQGLGGSFMNSPPASGDTRSRSNSLTGLELHPPPPHHHLPTIFPTPPSPKTKESIELVNQEDEDKEGLNQGGAPLHSTHSESFVASSSRPKFTSPFPSSPISLSSASTTSLSSNTTTTTTTTKTKASKLTFAPLPPGRRMFRSNSLTIGVAARASMLSSQGSQSAQPRARYAGPNQPMMWYQPGGQLPDDVYTYKDAARGINKLWSKVSRKKSTTSTTSSTSSEGVGVGNGKNGNLLKTEKEGKLNGNSASEIMHIEESRDILVEEDEDAVDGEEGEEEIKGLGLGLKGLSV